MNNRDRFVITGMGMVTPSGMNSEQSWHALLQGRSGVSILSFYDRTEGTVAYPAGVVRLNDDQEARNRLSNIMSPREITRSSHYINLAMLAADEALRQAEWYGLTEREKERTAVSIESAYGCILSILNADTALHQKGRKTVSAFTSPLSLLSMAASAISIQCGFRGPVSAPSVACAAGLQSFGEALYLLKQGHADVIVAGGSEAPLHPAVYAGCHSAGALSTLQNIPPESASRPFDVSRNGFVLAEGAAVFIILKLSHAEKRHISPLAEIVGYGASSDATHITAGHINGDGIARAMVLALQDSNIPPSFIGYLSAHATSTPTGDIRECRGIKQIFQSDTSVSISSVKGVFAHTQGAALAAGATIMELRHNLFLHTANTITPDPEMAGLDLILHHPRIKKPVMQW
ncbi:beta-ketoacyl-[acyl-carrier-protein] synthase family protein [Enterobacter cloacae]|uniref:beta-ketoacyl-[acyl-carrier-protein] synthase family protein n=1 Tax=Enterobacter cloacae TaxID=550 RepID=UPI00345D59E5